MQEEGAHLIDVGGESSRPGSTRVTAKEEIQRVLPVLKRLSKKIKIPVSIDTAKSEVAHAALDQGAVLVNDIYALRGDKRLAKLIARYRAGVALMHMRGDPENMQAGPVYRSVIKEVFDFLRDAVCRALDAGISRTRILVDPGFGFGKTAGNNMEILGRLEFFRKLECPVLVGLSRKSFIGHLLGLPVSGRLYGSLGAAAAAIYGGAHILRVHDVPAHRQLAVLVDQVLEAR